MKKVYLGFVGIGVLLLLIGGIWAFRYFTAPVRGIVGAYEQIQSGAMRISSYNYFFNLYASIQSYDISLAALQEQLGQVTSVSERERILATIAGLKGQKARAIAQYNADARKEYTIGQFRDVNLPYQIPNK